MGVRVPRITLKADFGDESAFGELSMLSVGYGLHQAWVFATMFGTASVFGAAHTFNGIYGSGSQCGHERRERERRRRFPSGRTRRRAQR